MLNYRCITRPVGFKRLRYKCSGHGNKSALFENNVTFFSAVRKNARPTYKSYSDGSTKRFEGEYRLNIQGQESSRRPREKLQRLPTKTEALRFFEPSVTLDMKSEIQTAFSIPPPEHWVPVQSTRCTHPTFSYTPRRNIA